LATDTAGLSKSEILDAYETGSKALNGDDFEALGGLETSALFKAPYIADWVDTSGNPLTTTLLQEYSVGAQLFIKGSGLTPNGYVGLGYTATGVSAAGNLGAVNTTSSSTGK